MNTDISSMKKSISISSKRQITIPQKFYDMLGFENEAGCYVKGNELVICPKKSTRDDDFSEQILEDLIRNGYSGENLLSKFKEIHNKIPSAVKAMMEDADLVAKGIGEFSTYDEIFGDSENEK